MIFSHFVDTGKKVHKSQRDVASLVVQAAAIASHAEGLAWRAAHQHVDISQMLLGPIAKFLQVSKIAKSVVAFDNRGREGCDFGNPDTFPAELLPSQVNGTDTVADAEITEPPLDLVQDHQITSSLFLPALRPQSSAYGVCRSSKSGAATRDSRDRGLSRDP